MFDLHDFVMRTLAAMRDNEPEYKVRQYALGWFQRDVLTEDDLAIIDSWYENAENGEADAETEASET